MTPSALAGQAGPSEPRVSVVVPVFNPGPEIEPCLASLKGQTLPASQYEVIFVDDGSTDGTAESLDAASAANPNMRVIHMAPSGAPGRPRNIGLSEARGRYVIFLDADDELALTALERMAGWGDRHRSDVVIGKYASASQPRGQAIFARNRGRMTLRTTPVLLDSSLGATKLFRVDFLRGAGIRFPEGWKLMEDQYFVLRAYFRARTISLLADQTYAYFRQRATGEHLSAQPLNPEEDLAHFRELLDMVESETPPGSLRARAIRRLYRAEILGRLAEQPFVDLDPAYRHDLFVAARRLATERIHPAIDDDLSTMARVRSRLLRENRENALLALAQRTAAIDLAVRIRRVRWEHGQLRLAFTARLVDRESGRSVSVTGSGDRRFVDPKLTQGIVDERIRIDQELATVRGNVLVRERETAAEWLIPTRLSLSFRGTERGSGADERIPVVRGEAHVNPLHVGPGGASLDSGSWGVWLRLSMLDLERRATLTPDGKPGVTELVPAILGDPPTLVTPTSEDGLWLHVSRPESESRFPRRGDPQLRPEGRRITIRLPIASDIGVRPFPGRLILARPSGNESWPAEVRHSLGELVLSSSPRSTAHGPVDLRAALGVVPTELRIGPATVNTDGSIDLGDEARLGEPTRAQATRWLVSRVLDEVRQAYERGLRLITPILRRLFEATPRPLRSPLLSATRFLRR